MKRFKLAKPTWGIGVLLGATALLATQAAGSGSAMGVLLGAGLGIAVGLRGAGDS